MADVEQRQKMIPFVTCEISLCLRVGFLFNLDLGVRVDSIKQTTNLWVLETCLMVGLLSFMIILITASLFFFGWQGAARSKHSTSKTKKQSIMETNTVAPKCGTSKW